MPRFPFLLVPHDRRQWRQWRQANNAKAFPVASAKNATDDTGDRLETVVATFIAVASTKNTSGDRKNVDTPGLSPVSPLSP